MNDAAYTDRSTHQAWRYAQRKAGQKLHLAEMRPDTTIAARAICGIAAPQGWRMTINVPLGHACGRCIKLRRAAESYPVAVPAEHGLRAMVETPAEETAVTPVDWPTICIMLLTFDRMEAADPVLRAILDGVSYSGALDVHIADDGSPDGYREHLAEIAAGYANVRNVGMTNAQRGGYGRSYNLASQAVHTAAAIVLPLEDDWLLTKPLDLDPLVATLMGDFGIGCIRLGYIGFTQELRGRIVAPTPAGMMLVFDATSDERHVAAGHPRLETVEWERAVGPWIEGAAAGATEFEWCGRSAARHGVAWPMDLVHPRGDLFDHIGARELGELIPEGTGG